MATAYRCDNCGEMFDGDSYGCDNFDLDIDGMGRYNLAIRITRGEFGTETPDLCSKCFVKLVKETLDETFKGYEDEEIETEPDKQEEG